MTRFPKIRESVHYDAEAEHDVWDIRAGRIGVKMAKYQHQYIGRLPNFTCAQNHGQSGNRSTDKPCGAPRF